jgi:uncharacterized ubiquitin-like protein YukD
MIKRGHTVELEIPTDITARELIIGLNEAYKLGIDITNVKECFLKCENPIALVKGNKLISEFGLRTGSIINYTK